MFQKQKVEIIRKKFTSRNTIQNGNYNLILSFKAEVLKNSYLFIGGAKVNYATHDTIKNSAIKIADEIIRISKFDYRNIITLLKKYKLYGELEQTRTNIDLFGEYIIPSSSLKGAIRSRLEYKFVMKDNKVYSCYSVISREYNPRFAKRHIDFWGEDVTLHRPSCDLTKSPEVCKVCDIFGTPSLLSRVDFSDAKPTGSVHLRNIELFGINFSVIPPETSFTFETFCRNFSMEDLGLLFAAMEIFTDSPIMIGRYKYRYNPNVGEKYKNQYYFGLLKIKFSGVNFVHPKWDYKDLKSIINASKDAIKHYIEDKYLDLNRGVIKL